MTELNSARSLSLFIAQAFFNPTSSHWPFCDKQFNTKTLLWLSRLVWPFFSLKTNAPSSQVR